MSNTDDGVHITVCFGKQQASIALPPAADGKLPVIKIKEVIEPVFGTPVASQKLLYRGKELTDSTILDLATLPSKPKMMLLSRAPSNAVAKPPSISRDALSTDATPSPAPPPPRVVEVVPVGENQVLVEVVRGKDRYRVAMDITSTILDVKTHVEGLIGVAVRSQRLLFKGKYPSDTTILSSLPSKATSSIVFMLLFDERQHACVEVQSTTVELAQQFDDYTAQLARLKAQISRNFFDAADVGLQLRQLLDAVEILHSNAEIANDTAPSDDLGRLATQAQDLRDAISHLHDSLITRRS